MSRTICFLCVWLACVPLVRSAPTTAFGGLDTGFGAVETLDRIERDAEWFGANAHPWLRIRGLASPETRANSSKVADDVSALRRLRELGFKTIAILRWEGGAPGEVRPGGGHRVTVDLRVAYARAKAYGRAYGDVTHFEIDNEPDISFVEENPETYAAFLKACYLGFKDGAAEAALAAGVAPQSSAWRRFLARVSMQKYGAKRADGPWVVMAPLALPPGPYFEQLTRNGLFSYTDAFNFHYYGYAEDFGRVYRQFEDAVGAVGRGQSGDRTTRKSLPVLLTEYGYGSLNKAGRFTREGRLKQWAWFRNVGQQAESLRIEGPMAFYLPPYLEAGAVEFGLTFAKQAAPVGEKPTKKQSAHDFHAGGLGFSAADFETAAGAASGSAWLRDIGRRVGETEATPALAWLLNRSANHPYRPKDWLVAAAPPSPVVLDFVSRPSLIQLKRYTGYMVMGIKDGPARQGEGDLVVYNFSSVPVRGRLELARAAELQVEGIPQGVILIPPAGRLSFPLRVNLSAAQFTRSDFTLRFRPEQADGPHSRFATAFYPEASHMTETVLTRFDEAEQESPRNRETLERRSQATEEVGFKTDGRWRVTAGVSVKELSPTHWKFSIAAFPKGEARPSVAELPLRDGFVFPEGGMLRFSYRFAEPAGAIAQNGRYCEAYFRTANGNLYQVWPRQYAIEAWSEYTEVKENYTMAFYSRANLPWRFSDNRPVALVFWFRPGTAPAAYEVKDARIVRLAHP